MKKIAKSLIASILGWQVKRLIKKNQPKVVAVVGSMGKTSTKVACATYLGQFFKVQSEDGNYNEQVTVPLVFFGHKNPEKLFSPSAWLRIMLQNEKQLKEPYPYDVVVVELGTDGPGQIKQFKKYLSPDVAIITAIAPEHMEFFDDIDAVAAEELSIKAFSKTTLVNSDLCKPYTSGDGFVTYGLDGGDYHLLDKAFSEDHYAFKVSNPSGMLAEVRYQTASELQLYGVLAAVSVGEMLGFPRERIGAAVQLIKASAGRMRVLRGIQGSVILDDTYNASPEAAKAALDTLYQSSALQKIALLGNMNELGNYSPKAHAELGEYCDPEKVDLVVTLGEDANAYTAVAAQKNGCNVVTANSPYEAGELIRKSLKTGASILAKGSQNGVFAEEAVKMLLADPKDADLLVRQSASWMTKKKAQFGSAPSKVSG